MEKYKADNDARAKLIAQIRQAFDAGKTVSVLGRGDLVHIRRAPITGILKSSKR